MSTSTKRKKKKGKDNDLLPKPKRPMSAYNFFFREQRNEILDAGGDTSSLEKKKSFEDIGRVIGQRWREILPDELAKYQELAKEDAERYRNEMKIFYEEELALMCSGHTSAAGSLDDDRKPSATDQKPTNNERAMQKSQQPQKQHPTIGQESFEAVTPSAALSPPSSLAMATETSANLISVDQLHKLKTLLQHQESTSFPASELNKDSLINEINAQRLATQQRLLALLQESEMLRSKDRLLEQLLSHLLGASGSSLNSTEVGTTVTSPAGPGLQHSMPSDLQSAFSHNAQGARTPGADNCGVTGPVSRIAPSLGQLFNQSQQALTTDNISLISQLMASQRQHHQQFAANSVAPVAAVSSRNQGFTTSVNANQSFANTFSNSLQALPINDLQTLIARGTTGSTNQTQTSGSFGLAGSFLLGNPNNSSQPPPHIASLIAQIIASQQKNERSSCYTGDGDQN